MKKRRNITRAKKAKISEILTDSSHAASDLWRSARATGKTSTNAQDTPEQHKMRGELAELRSRFSGMVQRGPVPIIVLDSDGYVREINDSGCQLFGCTENRVRFLSFEFLVNRSDKPTFVEHMKRCREASDEPVVTELRLRRFDKGILHARLVSTVFRRPGGDFFQTAVIDLTGMRRHEQELEHSRDFAETIVETIRMPLAVLASDLRIVSINRAFSKLFGVAPRQAPHQYLDKTINLRHGGEKLQAELDKVLLSGEPSEDVKVEIRLRGAVKRTLLINARPFFRSRNERPLLLVAMEDITDRQAAEAALQREQTMLARAESLAHVGSFEWDMREDSLIWSDELYRIFGVERSQFNCSYKSYLELIHPDDREKVDQLIRKALHEASPIDFQHRINKVGDGVRVLHCQGYFIVDGHGLPSKLLGTAQDITELRQAEDKLRAINHELEERTRLLQTSNEEMHAFSYSIAHDLRAPLRAIQGMSRILMEDYTSVLDASAMDYFGRIVAAAQRMDDLIRDLLDYARMTKVQLPIGPVDTEAIWGRVAANFSAEIKERAAVIEKPERLPRLQGHPTVVELALNNLFGNALKFNEKGKRPEIRIWTERMPDDCVRVNVTDSGIGIAPEHQQRIFRVFERLHPTEMYPGTGIGLAIVKKGIERVGGSVGLKSEPGKGSTFWFELPGA